MLNAVLLSVVKIECTSLYHKALYGGNKHCNSVLIGTAVVLSCMSLTDHQFHPSLIFKTENNQGPML
jgi:hypothetical protein